MKSYSRRNSLSSPMSSEENNLNIQKVSHKENPRPDGFAGEFYPTPKEDVANSTHTSLTLRCA